LRKEEAQNAAAEEARRQLAHQRFFERERLIEAVNDHRAALVRNLERAVKRNDYGAVIEDRRYEALAEFFASIRLDRQAIPTNEAIQVVSEQLASCDEQDRVVGFDPASLPGDGHAFESWVAAALSSFGWEAKVTAASGDQGIDVIATRDGRTLGLQCKLYSCPIGNKAVQEAHAGKAFYGAERVGVLSNATFTNSARDLATATGVLLLSHHDIPQLFEKAFPDTAAKTAVSSEREGSYKFFSPDQLMRTAMEERAKLFGGYLFDGQPPGENDPETQLYRKAVQIVAASRKASVSYLQRQLRVGYNSTARLIERMEKEGLVGPPDRLGRREVLTDREGRRV
jgi:restriction system protein